MHYAFKNEVQRLDSSDRLDFENYQIDHFLNMAILVFLKRRYGFNRSILKGFETDQVRLSQLAPLHVKSPELQPEITPTHLGNGLYEVRLDALGNDINGQYFRYAFLTSGYILARNEACTKYIDLIFKQTDDSDNYYNEASWKWRRVNWNTGRSSYQFEYDESGEQDPDVIADMESEFPARYNNDQLSSIYLSAQDKFNVQQYEIERVYLSYIRYPNRVFSGGYDHIDGLSSATSPLIHCDIDELFHDEIVRIAARLATKPINMDYNSMVLEEREDYNY